MERLPLTLTNIQPYVSSVAYAALSKVCDDRLLQQLSHPDGILVVNERISSRVHMEWHTDETDRINGIILCVYNNEYLEAWKILTESSDGESSQIIVTTKPLYTNTSPLVLHVSLANQIFSRCVGTPHEKPVAFNFTAETLEHPEQIQAFFGRNQEMLPEILRASLFPPKVERKMHRAPSRPQDSSSPSSSNNQYIYIVGGILLLLSLAYLAKRTFAKR